MSCCHVTCRNIHQAVKPGSGVGETMMSNADLDATLLADYFDKKL